MTETQGNQPLSEIFRMVIQHRRVFALGAAVFALVVLCGSHYLPLKYSASAMFERRSDGAVESGNPKKTESFQTAKLTLKHELAGQAAMEQAIEDVGLTREMERDAEGKLTARGLRQRELMAKGLMEDVLIRWTVSSDQVDLVEVVFTHSDRSVAEQMPNVLIRNYITRVGDQILHRLEESRDFLQKRSEDSDRQLCELKRKEIEFTTRQAGMLPENPQDLQRQCEEARSELNTLRRQRAAAMERAATLKRLIVSERVRALQEELAEYEAKLNEAMTDGHMTERHPRVQAIRKNIERMESEIAQAQSRTDQQTLDDEQGVLSNLSVDLIGAQSEVEALAREIERLEQRLVDHEQLVTNAAPVLYEYSQIKSQTRKAKEEAERWAGQLADVQVALEAERANRRTQLSAVQAAQKPSRPLFPRIWTIMGLAIAGGLGFGYISAFCVHTGNPSLASPQEAAQFFQVPICGVIDEIPTSRYPTVHRIRQGTLRLIAALVLAGLLLAAAGSVMLRLRHPEKFERLVSSVSRTTVSHAGLNGLMSLEETPESGD